MRLYLLCVVFILAGCVSPSPKVSLYKVYQEYAQQATRENVFDIYTQYFRAGFLDDFQKDEFTKGAILLGESMAKEGEYFEKIIDQNTGCLLIDGLSKQQLKPMELILRYERSDANWLIQEITFNHLENDSEYNKKALCPDEV